ncbi:MAG TPA: flippase-like domain-containing protein [Methylomirabilota bacterium]|nr:flippase-like domain-containing protein [Methylomirabilota bacterium]
MALFILGAVLFLVLLIRVGPGAVAALFTELSWYLPLIAVFPYGLMTMVDTLGWRFAFRRNTVPFQALLMARLAGEAFNIATPTASVGGEAVKTWLIRPYVSLTESIPAVVIAKTTITIGQALYLLLGLLIGAAVLPPDLPLLQAMRWLLGLELLGVGGFVVVQLLGVLGIGGRMLQRFHFVAPEGVAGAMGQVDSALAHFYREEPWRLLLSITYHFLGWALGALEAYLILWALGLRVSLATALVIDAFGSGIGFAAFLIPARLGATEAGQVAIFMALGLGAPAGLTFALIQRLREATWAGLGFLALTTLRAGVPPAVSAALDTKG